MAGGSVPSQLEAFKFKTKQNNPFLGSFFPSSIFVKSPTSPKRSGSQNPETKCLRASFASSVALAVLEGRLLLFVPRVTSCEGQQVPLQGYGAIFPRPLLAVKRKLWHISRLSAEVGAFSLTMDGLPRTDSSLISCLLLAVEPFFLQSRLEEPHEPGGVFTQHHTVLKYPPGEACAMNY